MYVKTTSNIILQFNLIFNLKYNLKEIIIKFCLLIIFENCPSFVKSFYIVKF